MRNPPTRISRRLARRSYASLVGLLAVIAARVTLAAPAPVAMGPWTGTIECTIEIETADFSRHETHTWVLTGDAPSANGVFAIWPAKWSATGHGAVKKMQGDRRVESTWTFEVPPRDTQIATFLRTSDNKVIFRQWGARGQVTGARNVTVDGKPLSPASTAAVEELVFPWISGEPSTTTVSGSLPIEVENLSANLSRAGAPRTATCTWRFVRSATGPDVVPQSSPIPGSPPPLTVIIQVTPADTKPAAKAPPADTKIEVGRTPASTPALPPPLPSHREHKPPDTNRTTTPAPGSAPAASPKSPTAPVATTPVQAPVEKSRVPIVAAYVRAGSNSGTPPAPAERATGGSPRRVPPQPLLVLFENGIVARLDEADGAASERLRAEGLASVDISDAASTFRSHFGHWTETSGSVLLRWTDGTSAQLKRNGENLSSGKEAWTRHELPDGVRISGAFFTAAAADERPWIILFGRDGRVAVEGVGRTIASSAFPSRGVGRYEIRQGSLILQLEGGITQAIAIALEGADPASPQKVLLNRFEFEREQRPSPAKPTQQ